MGKYTPFANGAEHALCPICVNCNQAAGENPTDANTAIALSVDR